MRAIQTAKGNSQIWKELEAVTLNEGFSVAQENVRVDSSRTYQTHIGFGGAFTEAAAYTLSETTKENQEKIIEAYFDKEKGIGYNLGRTTIACCDFSLEPYFYVEEGDKDLETFNMDRDEKWIIPMINMANSKAGGIKFLCSPWSPPPFMKDNNDVNHGGRLKEEYYQAWAKYMARYIFEMKNKGIDIRMVSIQNEPEAVQIWASCIYDGLDEGKFAVDYLSKELKNYGVDDVKIVIWDHNKDGIYRRVKESLSYENAKDVIWGVAYHWYVSDKAENLTMVHNAFPDMHIIFTEGCVELVNKSGGTSSDEGIGAWSHGETYGRNIINDLNNYCEGWIDWNLILNEQGGPNYVGNFCEAPIIIDRNKDEVIYNMSYYYIGHFSKYIKEGAKRILCENDATEGIYSLAYKNPDGQIVVVVQNELDRESNMSLDIDNKGVNIKIPAHSITTFILD